MNRPSLGQGMIVALIFAFVASVIAGALMPLVGATAVLQLLVPGISLGYVIYLLKSARAAIGNVTTVALWSAVAFGAWWFAPPLPAYVLVHVGAIWLIRALYFYSSLLPVLVDLGLSAVAACALAWAAASTGSVFIATWFFFLVQAFFVVVPRAPGEHAKRGAVADNESFERARRQADEALRLLTRQS